MRQERREKAASFFNKTHPLFCFAFFSFGILLEFFFGPPFQPGFCTRFQSTLILFTHCKRFRETLRFSGRGLRDKTEDEEKYHNSFSFWIRLGKRLSWMKVLVGFPPSTMGYGNANSGDGDGDVCERGAEHFLRGGNHKWVRREKNGRNGANVCR